MTPSQKGKMFLLRILGVIIQLEILTMKRKCFYYEIHLCVQMCLSGLDFSPFIALNINTTPSFFLHLCLKSSDDQRKYLMVKDRKLNNVIKICLLSCTVAATFLGKSVFLYAYFVISRLLLTSWDSNERPIGGFTNPGF